MSLHLPRRFRLCFLIIMACSFFCFTCASSGGSAEEYYSIGMAYFELGRYEEAERWLQRAGAADKTITASEYNLGRIAFETGRYDEALEFFDLILEKDPQNVMALKAAAYTRIKKGDLEEAEALYDQVMTLVPESADDGYNYALVLFAMEKYGASEEVLLKYPFALDEKPDSLLLLARAQDAADKVEAIDTYAKWVAGSTAPNPKVLHEYGKALEKAEHYARALDQYRASLEALTEDLENLTGSTLHFDIGRVLLIADPGNPEGMSEVETAVDEGFNDKEALEALANDSRIDDESVRSGIMTLHDGIPDPAEESEEDALDDGDGATPEDGVVEQL